MPITTKVEPIDRDIQLILKEDLSPEARSKHFAAFARDALREGQETNRRILGRVPPHHTFVDGQEDGNIDRVRPDGIIVFEFELVTELLRFIADQLRAVSPVKTGRYQASHTLFADGKEVPVNGTIPAADEYVFLSDVEYARKIEGAKGGRRPPQSPMAPRGVYQITATKANKQHGNTARVSFSWRSTFGGSYVPAAKDTGRVSKRGGRERDTRVPAIIVSIR